MRATRGQGYAFYYLPNGGNITAQLGKLSGKKVKAWWYNPRNGQATAIGKYKNSGTKTFASSGTVGRGNDWVLVLDDVRQKYGKPGVIAPPNQQ